ncbi:hypothetical protein [Mycobacterium sp. 141]|uniref:hypothetical protein n=1 Tax=Mycobacterium sp. 141 TaxID=1120797 RepID=UPI000374CD22|nr:hypothetical protein [Mycobacterium sp. 141]
MTRLRDVDTRLRRHLEAGGESRTHIEQMAIDFGLLARCVLPEDSAAHPSLKEGGFIQRMRAGGRVAWDVYGERLFDIAPQWASDTCRGWAAFAVPLSGRPIREQLTLAGVFAEDAHFAVREWAWLGVRPTVAADPRAAVAVLTNSARGASERGRRFASEVTRPRGVWSAHIPLLKEEPEIAFGLLDELVSDTSRYVTTSVGNWLNDAGRTRPEFVYESCARWAERHPTTFPRVRRLALRNLADRHEPA